MAQLVASMSGVVLGGVVEVVGSNLARGKIFTASIGSVDSLYPSVYIYMCIYIYRERGIYIYISHNHATDEKKKERQQFQTLVKQMQMVGNQDNQKQYE